MILDTGPSTVLAIASPGEPLFFSSSAQLLDVEATSMEPETSADATTGSPETMRRVASTPFSLRKPFARAV